ncbi:MAG: transposase [Gammaproteobacteria bacterium]|nr:transposase [Gammaproteobacteria bacterium]
MATFRRSTIAGATYFFTVNTDRRQKVLTRPLFYQALKQSLEAVKKKYPFVIEAFVLLPDHLHCIWTLPENDADYSTRWNIIKRSVSQQVRDSTMAPVSPSKRKRGELGLWQRRFWEHRIREERDFEKHVEYIHWNPVKHGYVKRVCDWPYSSFHRFVARGIYPLDWAGGPDKDDGNFGEIG